MTSFATVTVGVADLNAAIAFWVHQLGFEILTMKSGEDFELARLWGIQDTDVQGQAIVRTPGENRGMIHLVEFDEPGDPVRQGANSFDACPKNLDIYVEDMQVQVDFMRAAGWSFAAEGISEISTPDGTTVRKMHMRIHDHINLVLLQVPGGSTNFSPHGFCGIGPLVLVVDDAEAEVRFFESTLGLCVIHQGKLNGSAIEESIGLPKGAELVFNVLGEMGASMGRIEIVSYTGVDGNNLHAQARPKSLGVLHVSYRVDNLVEIENALEQLGVDYCSHGRVHTLVGCGDAISVESPAGFRVEVFNELALN